MDNYVLIILIDPPSKGALPNKSGELRTAFSRWFTASETAKRLLQLPSHISGFLPTSDIVGMVFFLIYSVWIICAEDTGRERRHLFEWNAFSQMPSTIDASFASVPWPMPAIYIYIYGCRIIKIIIIIIFNIYIYI